jgi:hypothetical protein
MLNTQNDEPDTSVEITDFFFHGGDHKRDEILARPEDDPIFPPCDCAACVCSYPDNPDPDYGDGAVSWRDGSNTPPPYNTDPG